MDGKSFNLNIKKVTHLECHDLNEERIQCEFHFDSGTSTTKVVDRDTHRMLVSQIQHLGDCETPIRVRLSGNIGTY